MSTKLLFITLLLLLVTKVFTQSREVDVCVYGATSGGVIAAYTAKKAGKTVLLVEPTNHLGGLTTGGLGYTDIGNKYAISGVSRNFYRRIGKHYGKFESWIFEPHVASNTFTEYINEAQLEVWYQTLLSSVKKDNGYIREIIVEHADKTGAATRQVIKAKMFIDCSYEGDLLAKAGVSYFVGREANSVYNETYNGVQVREKHQFPDGVDPYKIKGDSTSGLLWGISNEALAPQGSGDKKVQAYNFRICLTRKPQNRIDITKPLTYDPATYELLLRYLEKRKAKNLHDYVLKMDYMPNEKTDINNNGPFSTDMIGMNYNYPEADHATRQKIMKEHENYNKGLLYFIGHDERVPQHLREEMLQWGYPKDEYTGNSNWSPQMYVREARRMIGAYVMSQANCEGKEVVEDGVGMAAYTMDSHNIQRVVMNGMVKNEGDVQVGGFGPYPIAYRSLIPKANECKNLLVPVCLSASHIAYGSIRMEPVFMVLGQSAAVAAVLAINTNKTVQQVDVKKVQAVLKNDPLANGSVAEILVDNDDKNNVVIKGNWKKENKGSYGHSMFLADASNDGLKTTRFTPAILKQGAYQVYVYFPKLQKASSKTSINVHDGKKSTEVIIREKDIRVEGQTSGEWVAIGTYTLPRGNKSFVEITNRNADGVVVADAVLFVPGND